MAEAPENEEGLAAEDVEEEEDLWASDEASGIAVNRNVVLGVIAVVVVLVLGFAIFGGGSDGDGTKKVDTAAGSPGDKSDKTTQITSQRAPYSGTVVPSTLPPGAVPSGCGDWDTAFNYPPAKISDGVYLWSDFEGWHIRLAGTSVPSLTGSVTGQYAPALQSKPDAPGVEVKTDDVGKRLTFTLTAGDDPVGLDFSAGCKQKELAFDLTSGGTTVAFDKIHLGSRGIVKEFPLIARRTLPVPG